ncbi:integrase [Streptomyces sp. Root63]|uniref:tyrosine-type recombinase/integrase n=1 Tax=unclassified Streptomyces TaxID=2593676 RepID=UPI0006FDCFD7|nr:MULTISPECIES: tyrosine-type recombinase/integrase [unclassified Streptomyces]KQX36555.1 integrase [Streptomyces sp. Root1295]KRA36637.1 integrase [Streptomyces sp. Root63]
MSLTYDVRLYAIEVRRDRPKPFRLRWLVGQRKHSKSYQLKAQADGRRSELMSAVRRGEQFDEETGLPVSEIRAQHGSVTWYEHTRTYVDRKWATAPAKSRKNYADALATITPALVKSRTGSPDATLLRRALYGWAYNRNRWEDEHPEDVTAALRWLEKNSLPVSALEESATVRLALDALGLKVDGKPAAPRTARRKRACLSDVLGLAVEERYFTTPVNPLTTVKWVAPKAAEELDPESVANPRQVRALLKGVREQGARGVHLEAFFGCLYYAAMRPAEATALRRAQCHLPETGWGVLTLRQGAVRAGKGWTNDGRAHEDRHLKARAVKDSRPVPIPPHFVRLLREHIASQGTAPDGRLFRTSRGGLLQETGYGEVWAKARHDVLSEDEAVSPLVRRPYDLRHAGVSFWLSSGVDPMECARRAGHTIAVLFRVYAKVLAQTQDRANLRIDAAMREWNEPE